MSEEKNPAQQTTPNEVRKGITLPVIQVQVPMPAVQAPKPEPGGVSPQGPAQGDSSQGANPTSTTNKD